MPAFDLPNDLTIVGLYQLDVHDFMDFVRWSIEAPYDIKGVSQHGLVGR
jgi:hypothetical protein